MRILEGGADPLQLTAGNWLAAIYLFKLMFFIIFIKYLRDV
jgi:hypothetical protein